MAVETQDRPLTSAYDLSDLGAELVSPAPKPKPPPSLSNPYDISDLGAELEAPAPKAYTVGDDGNVNFDKERLATGIRQAVADGKINADWAKKNIAQAQDVEDAHNKLVTEAGSGSVAKALAHGAGMGTVFAVSAMPGAEVGASVGGPWAPLTGAIGGLATGTLGVWEARHALKALGDYSDAVKSFSASAELHPVADNIGNFAALGISPSAMAKAVTGKFAEAAEEIPATKLYRLWQMSPQAAGATIAKGAVGGALFEGVLRPAFDAAVKLTEDQLGVPSDPVRSPTWQSMVENVALGILTAGHSVQFRTLTSGEISYVMTRGAAREMAGIPLGREMEPEQAAQVFAAAGATQDADLAALSKPLTMNEQHLYLSLTEEIAKLKEQGLLNANTLYGASAKQAYLRTLRGPVPIETITKSQIRPVIPEEPGLPETAPYHGPEGPGQFVVTPTPTPTEGEKPSAPPIESPMAKVRQPETGPVPPVAEGIAGELQRPAGTVAPQAPPAPIPPGRPGAPAVPAPTSPPPAVAGPQPAVADPEDQLSPTDSLSARSSTPTKFSEVTSVSKIINDQGKEVYSVKYGKNYIGYSDNPMWESHPNYTGESKAYAKEFAAKRASAAADLPARIAATTDHAQLDAVVNDVNQLRLANQITDADHGKLISQALLKSGQLEAAAAAPPKQPAKAVPAQETTTAFDPRAVPVVEFPLKDIDPKAGVPQFKRKTKELQGKFERFPLRPIVLWQRLSGAVGTITGRHRERLARRSGETTIPAQIVKEADGFTRDMALTFDAESNIKDGQGDIDDFAHYFRNTLGLSRAEAESRGLLRDAKAEDAWDLAKLTSDDLYSIWAKPNSPLKTDLALAIARTAPLPEDAGQTVPQGVRPATGTAIPAGGETADTTAARRLAESLQRVGIQQAFKGRSVEQVINDIKAARTLTAGSPQQADLFGADDSAIRAMESLSKAATAHQREIQEQISAISGATKRPDIARKLGVDVKNPAEVARALEALKVQRERWQNWSLDPELSAQLIAETKSKPLELAKPESVAEQKERLAKEEATRKAKAEKEKAAEKAAKPLTGTTGDLGQGELMGPPPDLFAPPTPAPKPGPTPKLFTNDAAAAARERLRQKTSGGQLGTTPDPTILGDVVVVAGNVIERGAIKYGQYAKEMAKEVGTGLKQFFKAAYNQVRDYTEAHELRQKMTPREEVENSYDDEGNQIELRTTEGTGREPEPAGTVRGTGSSGRPGIRVVDEGDIPAAKPIVRAGQYKGTAGLAIDETQRLAINLTLTAFENGKPAMLIGDGTGSGKTGSALVIAAEMVKRTGLPSLIVTLNKSIITNRFQADLFNFGIPGDNVQFATYTDLSGGKIPEGEFGVVIYDESQCLKNAGSARAFRSKLVNARHKVFATATAMDSPTHAAYFLAQITGRTEQQIASSLGYTFQIRVVNGEEREFAVLNPNMSWKGVIDNIKALRLKAVKDGLLIRREYPFFGVANFHNAKPMTTEQLDEQKEIERYWDNRIDRARTPTSRRNYAGQKTLELSRWLEWQKFDEVLERIKADLQDPSRKIVVFAEGFSDTLIKGIGKTIPGILARLEAEMIKAGIKYAKVFEDSAVKKTKAASDFQENPEVRVLLATPKSGGAGLDMDDVIGDQPRIAHFVTMNFSGEVFDQMIGRVSRRNTASPAEVHIWRQLQSFSDRRRQMVLDHKLRVLRNIQAGEDLDTSEFVSSPEVQQRQGALAPAAQPGAPKIVPGFTLDHEFRKRWEKQNGPLTPTSKYEAELLGTSPWEPPAGHREKYLADLRAYQENLIATGKAVGPPKASELLPHPTDAMLGSAIVAEAHGGKTASSAMLDAPDIVSAIGHSTRLIEAKQKLIDAGWPVSEAQEIIRRWQAGTPQAALTREGETATATGEPPTVARSIDELRKMLPVSGLSAEHQKLVGAFLDQPVAGKLPAFTFMVQSAIEGGFQGSTLDRLVQVARNAEPTTGPHELLHLLWPLLPTEMQAEFDRLRVATIDKMLQEPQSPAMIAALEALRDKPTTGGDEFLAAGFPHDAYPLSSPEEFFTHSTTNQFKAQVGSMQKGFWARVWDIIRDFFSALKAALKLKPTQEELIKRVLAGDFKVTPEGSADILSRERQGALSPKEAREAGIAEQAAEGTIKTKMFGRTYWVIDRERITPESIAESSAVTKDIFDSVGLPSVEQEVAEDEPWQNRKGWILTPQGRDLTAEGKALVEILRKEIATKEQAPKAAGRLGNLINSVRLNFILGDKSAMSEMSSAVRLELVSIAQSDASARGIALSVLNGHHANDIKFIGRNLDTELGRVWSDQFGGDDLRRLMDDLKDALSRNADLEKALADALKTGPKPFRKTFAPGSPGANMLLDLVRKGGDAWDALKWLAVKNKWQVPSDEQLDRAKEWVDEWDRLSTLTPKESEEAGPTPEEQEDARREKVAVFDRRIAELRQKISTLFKRLRSPATLMTATGRTNVVSAIGDYVASNLLLKIGFATRVGIDIGGAQWLFQAPTSAIANSLGMHLAAVARGERNLHDPTVWREMAVTLGDAYKQQSRVFKHTVAASWNVLSGDRGQQVGRLMARVSVFDRAMQKAEELQAAGKPKQAFLMKAFTMMRFGYTMATMFHQLQGIPAKAQWMHEQVVAALRAEGMSWAEAKTKADQVMGNQKAELMLAEAEARAWFAGNNKTPSKAELVAATYRLLQAKQYERMATLGLPADEFKERNDYRAQAIGWNKKEEGGLGGAVADFMRGLGKFGEGLSAHPASFPIALPIIALTRFGNAIGLLINRKLSWTPLGFFPGAFGVNEYNTDSEGVAHGGSPFYKHPEDRDQRRVEAAWGTAWMILLAMLAVARVIIVRQRWPKDKLERERWDKNGWRPGQISIPTGDGTEIKLSMGTGPLLYFAPGLAAGGALADLLESRAKAQKKLDDEAAKLGVPAGKIKPLSLADLIAPAATAAWTSLTSGRVISGLLATGSDYGTFNPTKLTASVISAYTPTLPGLQELGRMIDGHVVDSRLASVWDYLSPLPTSADLVNFMGDKVGSANDVQHVVQILTGGNYPFPVRNADNLVGPYKAVLESGFSPPSINPNQAHVIGGEYRPLTKQELSDYTLKRGQLFAQNLAGVSGDDPKAVQAAFNTANQQALEAVGVTTTPKEVSAPAATARPAAGLPGLAQPPRLGGGVRAGGFGRSSFGRRIGLRIGRGIGAGRRGPRLSAPRVSRGFSLRGSRATFGRRLARV
jgi:hypothetical protein